MTVGIATTAELSRWWWTFILRGVLAILFGIIAFISPPVTIAALVLLFGAWALVDGVFDIVAAIRHRTMDRSWWLTILEGIVGIVVGLLALAFPDVAAGALLLLISAWSIVTGVIEIFLAIRLREQITGELWLAIAGVLSIVFGVLLFLISGGRCAHDRVDHRRLRDRLRDPADHARLAPARHPPAVTDRLASSLPGLPAPRSRPG